MTPGEISASVEKIRRRYDEYISRYYKPRSLREAFEDRYRSALRGGVDVSSFLLAEISAIEELMEREEQRSQSNASRQPAVKEPSFADKVVEENRKRIEKYPEAALPADAGEELLRLVGALADLERVHWPHLGHALRHTMYAMSSSEMLAIDSQLRFLASRSREDVPQALLRLMAQLRGFPRNFPAIDREVKEYILQAAFFLNDLLVVLERVKGVYKDLGSSAMAELDATQGYVTGIISDFRLKEFKRKRRGDRDAG